jgi:CheY-like chemotaxis protein
MGSLLRILLIEDDLMDAELFTYAVKREGLPHRIWCVTNAAELQAALPAFDPQVIVCDFSLPGFSGFEALAITRKVRPDTPFFFSSGSLGSERVQMALTLGATGYALKGDYDSLLAQIKDHTDCNSLR